MTTSDMLLHRNLCHMEAGSLRFVLKLLTFEGRLTLTLTVSFIVSHIWTLVEMTSHFPGLLLQVCNM
jgi:hypothetical protein